MRCDQERREGKTTWEEALEPNTRVACTDLVVGFFLPQLSSPSFPSVSSTCGLNKSQILLWLANAVDDIFRSGKSFSLPGSESWGEGKKDSRRKINQELNSKIMVLVLYAIIFFKYIHCL